MNNGAFGENFPYSNFHDLNMDWIIKIAKDFLDQYTHIQEIIEQGKTDIENLTDSGLTQLQDKADALEEALQAWYNEHSNDIANQLATALADLNAWYVTHQNYLDQTLTDNLAEFTAEAEAIARETIETIPQDYTTLYNMVLDIIYHNQIELYHKSNKLEKVLESGTITVSGEEAGNDSYSRSKNYIEVNSAFKMTSNYNCLIACYDNSKTFIERLALDAYQPVTINANTKYIRVVVQNAIYNAHSDDMMVQNLNIITPTYIPYDNYKLNEEVEVPQIEIEESNYIDNHKTTNLFNKDDVQVGAIDGSGFDNTTSSFTKTMTFVPTNATKIVGNYDYFVCEYTEDFNFISRTNVGHDTEHVLNANTKYVRFLTSKSIYNAHKDEIMICENALPLYGYRAFEYIVLKGNVKPQKSTLNGWGKMFNVYRFGGSGNDWCFVRTPKEYNPVREKPYPFVIFNHGNGLIMNGDNYNATYTPRQMYLDPDNPHFNSAYNMIATTDPELQYSNPTFEKFLSEGYIVCGCENYGDGLYGNNDCRNACADFFEHMVRTYNVYNWCYMVGASNGALTSINASYILGQKVRGMVLQYPLTCLVNQYYAHPDHASPIRAAYGLEGQTPTEAELIKATATHDVLHTDIVDGIKVGYFPPTKVYYSRADDVVPYTANAEPFIGLLLDSTKVVEWYIGTGGHGDNSLFDPTGFFNFLTAQ